MIERNVRQSILFVRGELERLIAAETSSFRARLFERELLLLNHLARTEGRQQTPFSERGLADVLMTVALYTLDSLDVTSETEAVVTLDRGETMKRISLVLATARALKR